MQIQGERTAFNRPRWELKPKSQPHPAKRWCHTATTHGSHLYLMGGRLAQSAKTKEYAYRINCETFHCEPILLSDNPLMRESHSCALINDSMYVLFGINKAAKVLNDCLHLKITPNSLIWQKKNQISEIEPRESHMSVILDDRYILIYGGLDKEEKLIEDFHIYDLERQNWKKISKIEGEIQGKVGGTLINIKNQIYLFGGQINDQNQYSNQIYKIQIHHYKDADESQETFIQIFKLNVSGPKPLPRSQFASTVYKDRYLIVVGGQGPGKDKNEPVKLLNDIWAFDTQKLIWEEIIPENPNHFKPRSSFTANIHKQNLIVFGGLISIKDFKLSDEIYVLNLSSQVERKPICNLCKSSYKPIPKQEIQIEKSKGIQNRIIFHTSLSTIFAISRTIQDPFVALGTLLHSFDNFQIEKCAVICSDIKLRINLKKININDMQWKHILESYEFVSLIHEQNERVRKSLSNQLRRNLVNYLSYNIKNTCFRLGNQMLISFINSKQELQICLINKFGIYYLASATPQDSFASQSSIIFSYMKEYNINMSSLFQSSMSIFVTSLKQSSIKKFQKQIKFDQDFNDIAFDNKLLKDYLKIAFARPLSFQLAISQEEISFQQNQMFSSIGSSNMQNEKWPQTNPKPQLFQQILTYHIQGPSLILVYKQNKLMHSKIIDSLKQTVIEFHLTKNIEYNLTFSDVIPTNSLVSAIKQVVIALKQNVVINHKREKSLVRLEEQILIVLEQKDLNEQPTKTVKKTDQIEDGQIGTENL